MPGLRGTGMQLGNGKVYLMGSLCPLGRWHSSFPSSADSPASLVTQLFSGSAALCVLGLTPRDGVFDSVSLPPCWLELSLQASL